MLKSLIKKKETLIDEVKVKIAEANHRQDSNLKEKSHEQLF